MENTTVTFTKAERDFLINALLFTIDSVLSKLDESYDQDEPMSTQESAQTLVDNVVANATHEIEVLKEQIAERDKEINRLREEMDIPVVRVTANQADKKKSGPAPYGYKADGTPKKRPGRPSKKGKK